MKVVTELNQFVESIAPEAKSETFRDGDIQKIWDELNKSSDHRTQLSIGLSRS
jgi:hypothetical protein